MGRDLAQAISLLGNLNIGLKNKKEILSFLTSKGINSNDADTAYKVGLKDNTRLSFTINIEDGLSTIMAIPHMTLPEAVEALINKGMNAEVVQQASKGISFDELDNINQKPDSLLSPYLQDAGLAYDQNERKVSEIDTNVLSDLVSFIEKYPDADDSQIEKFLEAHQIDSNQSRAIIRMIHLTEDYPEQRTAGAGFEPNMVTDGKEMDLGDLADILITNQNMDPQNALNAMVTNGIPADEAARAVRSVREESYEDKYDRPQGDLGGIMGPGATEEGPTDMPPVDSGGDPMPNNLGGEFGATGEDLGAGTVGQAENLSTVGMGEFMQETNPAEGNPIHDQATREGEEDWTGMADGFLRENPNMSTNELGALLGQNGAPQSTVRNIMRQFESGDSGTIRPGASVSYKGSNFKVAGTTSTLYGDMIVLSNGDVIMADDENLGPVVINKEASVEVTFEKLIQKASKFFDKEYTYDEPSLAKMAKKADKLIRDLNAYEPKKMSEAVGIKDKVALLRTASAVFKEHAENQSKETQEYLDSLPHYHVGMVESGHEFGPGGGDAIAITASEMEQEHEELIESWPKTAVSIASQLVEDNPEYMGSTGDMRRMASRYVDAKFAHMDGEVRDEVRTSFIGLVEKARRIALRDLPKKEARVVDNELPHNYDEGVFF